VMFGALIDGGQTFGDKISLSNTAGAESMDAEIAKSGDSVFVTWWERNQTANDPVMKISNDNGKTFGALLRICCKWNYWWIRKVAEEKIILIYSIFFYFP
jgi:hypothetical protein